MIFYTLLGFVVVFSGLAGIQQQKGYHIIYVVTQCAILAGLHLGLLELQIPKMDYTIIVTLGVLVYVFCLFGDKNARPVQAVRNHGWY